MTDYHAWQRGYHLAILQCFDDRLGNCGVVLQFSLACMKDMLLTAIVGPLHRTHTRRGLEDKSSGRRDLSHFTPFELRGLASSIVHYVLFAQCLI